MAANMGRIDWASEIHALCVVDEQGACLRERMVDHSEDRRASQPSQGRPRALLRGSRQVRPLRRLRPGRAWPAPTPTGCGRSGPTRMRSGALRALTRTREDLVGVRVELANQLRAQLEAFWPGALIFSDVDSPISLAFLARYPSPADARGLGPKRMEGFLARHQYCGRRSPEELLERMRKAPVGRAGELEAEARRAAVFGLVAALRPIVTEIAELTSQIRGALAAHPDAAVFAPLFAMPRPRSARQP